MAQQELIAVILASTPVPPLPQMVIRGDDNTDSFTSSHDILAAAMLHALYHGNQANHDERRHQQINILTGFQKEFEDIQIKSHTGYYQNESEFCKMIYDTLCAYTRSVIATYDPQGRSVQSIDLRFEAYHNIRNCKSGESIFDTTYDHVSSLINIINHEIENSEDGRQKIHIDPAQSVRYDTMLQLYYRHAWI
jgi:hypothetical protein